MTYRRKRIKHFHEPGDCHELTFSCYQRLPLLTNDSWCEMLADSIERAVNRYEFRMVAFVFMPEHVHSLVCPATTDVRIDRLLAAIKQPFSYRVKQSLIASKSPLLGRLTVRERPDVYRFRFWQEGPGYDRNMNAEHTICSAIEYIHLNPVRRGLCQRAIDWRWSSARNYVQPTTRHDPKRPHVDGLPAEFFVNTTRKQGMHGLSSTWERPNS